MVLYLFKFSRLVETPVFTSVTVIKNQQYNRLIPSDFALNWKYRPHRGLEGGEGGDFSPGARPHPTANSMSNISSCSMVTHCVYVSYSIFNPHLQSGVRGQIGSAFSRANWSQFHTVGCVLLEVLHTNGQDGRGSLIDREGGEDKSVCLLFLVL